MAARRPPDDVGDFGQSDEFGDVSARTVLGRASIAGVSVGFRTRQGIGLIALLGVVVVIVTLPAGTVSPAAWVALAAAAALLLLEGFPVVGGLLHRGGGPLAAAAITLLVIGTGNADSPFQDLFALVLVYSAIVHSRERFGVDVLFVIAANVLLVTFSGGDRSFVVDAIFDVAIWITVAALARAVADRTRDHAARASWLRAVIDDIDDLVLVLDPTDLRIVYANRASFAHQGLAPNEIRGTHPWSWTDALPEERLRSVLAQLQADGGSVRLDMRATSAGDPDRHYDSVARLVGEGPEAEHLVVVARNVTEQREQARALAEREERFRTLAEQARSVVYRVAVRPQVQVEYLSPRINDLLGLDADAVLADPSLFFDRMRPQDAARFVPYSQDHPHGHEGVDRYHIRGEDGAWLWVEDQHRPERDSDGEIVATQGMLFDVTARAELELARVEALAHQEELANELEHAALTQQVFLRSISHELRTPLTTVSGFARTLETRYDQLDDDQRRNLIERLAVNADHLAALLADLLDLDHVEVQALLARARPLRLRAIVESTLQRMPGTDGVDWEVPDAEILGDAARLGRAIGGLVANALGHASSATAVRIRGEVSAAKVVLRVEDDGPGVPASIRHSLFTAFVQGPAAATSSKPGMGIGLATVEQVATMHGGDVWYEDVEPHGARFCLRLPLAPDVAPEVASDTPSPTAR